MDHLGQVGAGTAVDFYDHQRASLILRPHWVRDFKEVATVEVSGDSLTDEGIYDGDRLVIKRVFDDAEIRSGKLVVAVLPTGRSVIKRLYFENDDIILRSANPAHADLIFGPDEIQIDGIVKELVRKLD